MFDFFEPSKMKLVLGVLTVRSVILRILRHSIHVLQPNFRHEIAKESGSLAIFKKTKKINPANYSFLDEKTDFAIEFSVVDLGEI